MADLTDQQKIAMAKQVSLSMHKMMAGVPEQVALEATIMLLKALFIATVKPERRLGLYNAVVSKMRDEIKAPLPARRRSKP